MKMLLTVLLILIFDATENEASSVNETEKKMFTDIFEFLNIRQCIFLSESKDFFNFKFKNWQSIPTTFMAETKFFQHCFSGKVCFYVKTIVVTKLKNMNHIVTFLGRMKKVSLNFFTNEQNKKSIIFLDRYKAVSM